MCGGGGQKIKHVNNRRHGNYGVMQFCMLLDETHTQRHKMIKESRSLKMQSIISGTCNFKRT